MKNVFKFLGLIGVFFLMSSTCSLAKMPELSSDQPIEFDSITNIITARGHADLTSDNAIIKADEISFNRETLDATATNNVSVSANGIRLITECAQYNASDETVNLEAFRGGQPPIFISGNSVSGILDDLYIETPTVFLGEPDAISPNLIAYNAELKNAKNDCMPTKVIARHILFRIGRIPFFYLPYFAHTVTEIPFDILNENGSSKKLGQYTRNTVLFKANPYGKLGALIDYYTQRGFLVGPAAVYRKIDACDDVKGIFQSGFIYDQGTKSELGRNNLEQPIQRRRYFIEWQHQQNITEDLQITGQLRKWSDSASLRDFRPNLFNGDQNPDNFVEAVYTGPNYYLTAFTRYYPNNFQDVEQRIPEFNFHLLPTRIGCTPVFNTINATIGHLRETHPIDNRVRESTRMDVFYGLNAPFNVNEALTFTPVLGGEINEYFTKNTSSGTYTRYRGQIGFDSQFNAYGQWDYTNRVWNIDGLRHIIRPIVNYRFIPKGYSGTGPVPRIDRRVFTTNITPLDLAYLRDVDDAKERNTVRFGFETMLQTRSKCYGSRDIISLKMYQDYLIKKNLNRKHWSFWYTELTFAPAYWVNFTLYDRVNVIDFRLDEMNTCLTFTDARFWTLQYTINFLERKNNQNSPNTSFHQLRNQHYVDGSIHITPRTSIRGRCRYDSNLNKVTQAIGSITTRLGNAWQAEFQIIHRRKAVRESNFEMALLFNLLPLNFKLLPIPL